jgi:hypothetical protein
VLSFFTDRFQFGEESVENSHYQDREEMFDGAVVIFRRGDAVSKNRVWQGRFKLDGMIGYKTISLKTKNISDAKAKAKEAYLRFSQMVKEGASLKNRTFEQAWKVWFNDMVEQGRWSENRKKWHQGYFDRYFSAYFKDKRLDEITEDFANGYWSWRRRFWVDGSGASSIGYNRRRKGMKTVSTHNAKQVVAFKTLSMEQSALNQFFNWCHQTKRFMRFAIKMKVVASQKEKNDGRRATFTAQEWQVLTRNLLSWSQCKGKYAGGRVNEWHRHHREQLRYYVLFLSSTGIRSGTETRFMKWEDIEFGFRDQEGKEGLKIRIRAKTKRGTSRTVISQESCVAWMKEWKAKSYYNGDQDFVWYGMSKKGEKQKAATDLNKTFQAFLKTVDFKGRKDGLLNDQDGKRRSLYSLRHFYATQRLISGVSYEDLRKNMGTSIEQLVAHYDWATTEQRAAEITKTKWEQKKKRVDQLLGDLTDAEKVELKRQLQAEGFGGSAVSSITDEHG